MRLNPIRMLTLAVFAVALLSAMPVLAAAQTDPISGKPVAKTTTTSTTRRTTRRRRRRPVAKTPPAPTTVTVPVGSDLKIRLNDTISSKTARVGDKFTATVIDPAKYTEATVSG